VALSLPDGTPLIKPPAETFDAKEASQDSLKFSKALTSRTQPLLLSTSYRIAAGDLLVNTPILFGLGIIAVILIIIFLVIHLLSRTRSAELRARHGEQEARIAHASRVNSLGEIASGLSHELTQPLTAILSQSQAGMHLISRGESSLPSIAEILQSNVRQSKRASNILSRLRDWSRQAPAARTRQALNTCIDNVASLLAADARSRGIELVISCDESNPGVMGDAVEIEQLVFNLVRNAIEALERSNCANPRVQVSSRVSAQQVIVEVMDNGPGIAADMQSRLFEPFATDKENGMGIGLVLCERIVDRMEGSLEITAAKGDGVCACVSLPLA
jgi:C4-dicarboxylate-specific signal transduction histidine kinase